MKNTQISILGDMIVRITVLFPLPMTANAQNYP